MLEPRSPELLLVLRTPRTPWIAASIGEVRYVSISSAEAPGQLALTVSFGSSTAVLVASGKRTNAIAPASISAIPMAQTTAGRVLAHRIIPSDLPTFRLS